MTALSDLCLRGSRKGQEEGGRVEGGGRVIVYKKGGREGVGGKEEEGGYGR